jgi:hypothetical protein
MATPPPGIRAVSRFSDRVRCWVESLVLALGSPLAICGVSRLISFSIPAASYGSPEQRFLIWASKGAVVLWSLVIVLWLVLRSRGLSFHDLGVWRLGTWPAWVLAFLFAALSIASNLRFLPRMHVPISYAFLPPGLHLPAALIIGISGGFCEESCIELFSDRVCQSRLQQGRAGRYTRAGVRFISRWLSRSRFSSVAWPHASDCISRHDVGNFIPLRTPQPDSGNSRPLSK